MRIVTLVLRLTPYGVLALMINVVATSDFVAIINLGKFVFNGKAPALEREVKAKLKTGKTFFRYVTGLTFKVTSDFVAIINLGKFVLASYVALIIVFAIHMLILITLKVNPVTYLKKVFPVLNFVQ
jgi:L-cystine uptake protein TcyP (sodium:dicarboxylate symporter family)